MIERKGRRERRYEDPLAGLTEKRGYGKLKEEALDLTLWRTRFGRGHGPFLSQAIERINIGQHQYPSTLFLCDTLDEINRHDMIIECYIKRQ
jgi:hypothetical protein